mgnify:CR=1 FL=1
MLLERGAAVSARDEDGMVARGYWGEGALCSGCGGGRRWLRDEGAGQGG